MADCVTDKHITSLLYQSFHAVFVQDHPPPFLFLTPLPASNSLSRRQLFNKKRITYKCYHKSLNLLLPTALSIAQSYRARMLRDYQKLYRTLDASDAIPFTALLLCCHIIHHHRHLKCRLCVEWCDGMRGKNIFFICRICIQFPSIRMGMKL